MPYNMALPEWPNTSNIEVTFTVTNQGTLDDEYTLTCSGTGGVSCTSLSTDDILLGPGQHTTVDVTFNVGSTYGEIHLIAHGSDGVPPASGDGYYNVKSPLPVVTPDSSQVSSAPVIGARRRFTVTQPYGNYRTYNLSVACTGAVSGCTAPTQVTFYQSTYVYVSYNVEGTGGSTGAIALIASDEYFAADTGTVSVTFVRPAPVIARDLCLAAAVGQGAVSECGDLRIVHPLPSVRTLGKVRTPTLLYNSQHARPRPIVATTVALTAVADSVVATLSVGGLGPQSRSWPGSQFPVGAARRVGVVYDAGSGVSTGLYAYTLEVKRYNGSSPTTIATISDSLVLVNRAASPFGAGWWLAGFEQLTFPSQGGILWVGGDGSARRYRSVGSNTYVAAPLDHPDTLLYRSDSTEYVRILPGGDSVVFNSSGYHTRTVNRLGYRTEFVYMGDGSNRLWKIRIPPRLDSLVYTFTYGSGAGRLNQVTAPDTAGGSGRLTVIGTSGTRITSIQDPGDSAGIAVQFGLGTGADSLRIVSRTNRRGATTFYGFDSASRLREAKLGLSAAAADTIRTTFTTIAETRGVSSQDATVPDRDSLFTRLDGPRTDIGDTSTFWMTPFNGVRQVQDPYGYRTVISRADSRWPALPTRTQAPGGRIMGATYDARGNIASVADSNPYGDGQNPTTQYSWDQRWDELTQITLPNGQLTRSSLNASNGNVNYVEDARGSAARTNFTYVSSGYGAGLVQTVVVPGGATTTYAYDILGNLASRQTPLGWTYYSSADRLGRPRIALTPLGPTAGSGTYRSDTTAYDAQGRTVRTSSYGPPMYPAYVTQLLTVTNWFDAEGNLVRVDRHGATGAPGNTLTSRWTFDAANRPIVAIAPDSAADSTFYDLAGNVIRVRSRRGTATTMTYDRLNRLLGRVVESVTYDSIEHGIDTIEGVPHPFPWFPNIGSGYTIAPDTATFAYDSASNLIRADNGDARVRRGYFRNGQLNWDSLYIRDVGTSSFSHHQYRISYGYDLNGRVAVLRHPAQLSRWASGGVTDTVRMTYDSQTGELSNLVDLQGNQFGFIYNARGEVIQLNMPGNVRDTLGYDVDGNNTYDRISHSNPLTGNYFPQVVIRQTQFEYNDPLRVYRTKNTAGWLDSTTAGYSGLGHLVSLGYVQHGYVLPGVDQRLYNSESFAPDPLGNVIFSQGQSNIAVGTSYTSTSLVPRTMAFTSAGRLRKIADPNTRTDSLVYNLSGDLEFVFSVPNSNPSNSTLWFENRASYYAADGKMRAAEWRSALWQNGGGFRGVPEGEGTWQMAFEEYRYDALGRRVFVRERRACNFHGNYFPIPCSLSKVRRIIWAGDRELWEVQMPGRAQDSSASWENDTLAVAPETSPQFAPGAPDSYMFFDPHPLWGRVGYVYGGALDQPLSITKIGQTDWAYGSGGVATSAPFTVVPHWNSRGQADYGLLADGTYRRSWGSPTHWIITAWRHRAFAFAQDSGRANDQSVGQTFAWLGSLVQDNENATRTLYRRNRYVDPLTGQFTQEDPIGLGGGLNLYGFGGADPVNFGDPLGLCPLFIRIFQGRAGCARWAERQLDKAEQVLDDERARGNPDALPVSRDSLRPLDGIKKTESHCVAGEQKSATGCQVGGIIYVNVARPPAAISATMVHEQQHVNNPGDPRGSEPCAQRRSAQYVEAMTPQHQWSALNTFPHAYTTATPGYKGQLCSGL